MFNQYDLTLLSEEQIWERLALEVIKKYGTKVAVTDLAILTGAYCSDITLDSDESLKGRTGYIYTKSSDNDGDVRVVYYDGIKEEQLSLST